MKLLGRGIHALVISRNNDLDCSQIYLATLEELQDLLDDTADDIAQVLPDISEWPVAMV